MEQTNRQDKSPSRRTQSAPARNRQQATRHNRSNSRRRPVRHEVSAGGVVVRREDNEWLVALLKTEHKRGEVWVLPKGHVEPEAEETVADAAKREVQEEAGISDLSIKDQLGVTHYSFQAETALVRKTVHYFLMSTEQKKLTPQQEEGLIDAVWQPIGKAINMLAYITDQDIVKKAQQRLTGNLPARHRQQRPAALPPNQHRPRRRSLKIHT